MACALIVPGLPLLTMLCTARVQAVAAATDKYNAVGCDKDPARDGCDSLQENLSAATRSLAAAKSSAATPVDKGYKKVATGSQVSGGLHGTRLPYP